MSKHLGWLFLAAAAALYYSSSQMTGTTVVDTTTFPGNVESALATFNADTVPGPVNVDIMLAAVGVYILLKGN
jgi:hypothetical protein